MKIMPGQLFMFGFLFVIFAGAGLLMLPIASRSGNGTDFITALFTATSATCVTGLVIQDTFEYWTVFGQIVILVMIQLGGLGFMTLVSVFYFFLRRTIGLKQRLVMVQSLNLNDVSGIVRLTKYILLGTLIFEGSGALILSIRFSKDFGLLGGIYKGIFHAVSAFCNAGFDLMGEKGAFTSLVPYAGDFIVNVVIMMLITVGGIGFFVWEDVYRNRGLRGIKVYSKVAIGFSFILIAGGALMFFFLERTNPGTMANMKTGEKILASFFQSVTSRTAGYNTIDQMAMTEASKAMTIVLMFIGASSGSTGGGIKTVTAAVLLLASISALRGKSDTVIFGRSITMRQIQNALALSTMAMTCIITGSFAISMFDHVPFFDALFEAVSAFGTVGLSLGLTPQLSSSSHLVLILLMFGGRIGILTIGYAVLSRRYDTARVKYPEVNFMIG